MEQDENADGLLYDIIRAGVSWGAPWPGTLRERLHRWFDDYRATHPYAPSPPPREEVTDIQAHVAHLYLLLQAKIGTLTEEEAQLWGAVTTCQLKDLSDYHKARLG